MAVLESANVEELIAHLGVPPKRIRLQPPPGGGMQRVAFGQVRLPDVSFYLWSRFPNRELTLAQILDKVADLAVEVLSPSNTEAEMKRKCREFFAGGAKLFWIVDPDERTVEVFTAPEQSTLHTEADTL